MPLTNILVLAEGQLGDLLLLTPALDALRAGHPRATITVLIYQRRAAAETASGDVLTASRGTGTASVMTLHPAVQRVYEVDRSRLRALTVMRRVRAELGIVRAVRRERFDGVLCTFPEDRFSVLAFLSGARVRAGEAHGAVGRLLTVHPGVTRREAGVLRYYCALAEAMGGHVRSMRTSYPVPADVGRGMDAWLEEHGLMRGGFVAIHPGASGVYKQWPPSRHARLVAALQKEGVPVVLVGGADDMAFVRTVAARLSAPVPVLGSGTDVALLAAFLERAAVCVTNDSGPRHLAVAVGTPSIALFRRHHGREWAVYEETEQCRTLTGSGVCPVCPPDVCLDRVPAGESFGSYCVREIGVDEVLHAVLAMRAATSSGSRRTSTGGTDPHGQA